MTEQRAEGLKSRALILAACLACAFLALLARLGYLQVYKHDEYARLADNPPHNTGAARGEARPHPRPLRSAARRLLPGRHALRDARQSRGRSAPGRATLSHHW